MQYIMINGLVRDTDTCTELSVHTAEDLQKVPQFKVLTRLHLCGLSDITLLSQLPLLQHVSLTDAKNLADLSPLSALPRLKTLKLDCCPKITTFETLVGCKVLRSIICVLCSQLHDVSHVKWLPAIEALELHQCVRVTDVAATANIDTLVRLLIHNVESPYLGTPNISDAEWEIVRRIPLDRVRMQDWHSSCGTAHCLAGWAQVLASKFSSTSPAEAGRLRLPSLQRYFLLTEHTEAICEMLERMHAARGSTPMYVSEPAPAECGSTQTLATDHETADG